MGNSERQWDKMGVREYKGAAPSTTLSGSLTSGATTIVISSGTNWPTGSFSVVIDPGLPTEEKVLVTSRSGTSLTVTTRGYDDTSASAHSSGATIYPVPTAIDFQEANTHINSTTGVHGGLSTFQTAPIGGFYGIPGCNFGSNSRQHATVTASKIYYMPFKVDKPITISELALGVYTAAASAKIRISIYNATTTLAPGTLILDAGEVDCSTVGKKAISGLTTVLPAGLYLFRIHTNASCAGLSLNSANYSSDFIIITDYVAFISIYNSSGWSSSGELSASLTYGAAETPGTAYTVTPINVDRGIDGFIVAKWTVN